MAVVFRKPYKEMRAVKIINTLHGCGTIFFEHGIKIN